MSDRLSRAIEIEKALEALDYKGRGLASWVVEREQALLSLRTLCGALGDNDWPDDLQLCDIIDKHLGRYLMDPGLERPKRELGSFSELEIGRAMFEALWPDHEWEGTSKIEVKRYVDAAKRLVESLSRQRR